LYFAITAAMAASSFETPGACTARHALPVIFQYREYALAGGLMSYGTSLRYMWHQAGIYAGRILKGEKPGDMAD
jgi:putative ABC transport system substrate-binding protein